MKKKKIIIALLIMCLGMLSLAGCADQKKKTDFSGIDSVCELATLKCYYHNVARAETQASGLFEIFGVGYKKIWTEYSGIVELGIDVNEVSISQPDDKGVVKISIPDAQVLNVDLDEKSMGEPLTDTGFLTSITKEEETATLSGAQQDMKETAQANTALLKQAKERAKDTIEGYVINVGKMLNENYTVEWTDHN